MILLFVLVMVFFFYIIGVGNNIVFLYIYFVISELK